ncbi:efflux RND transporter periplasmic adaptor subunit [Ectothiorhodospira mobilis]|jgi:RND family efflux transporter MFP subunit|uniref:efflux RND transporter periplasmic adaptor subunit n=1 Tax=Ectothiorhodospira mobilis TaxID=195064 RepID=UPI001EE8D9EC|nr:efflux RND transporter periplasmic adaptor subunit [Ectothiorhodospira mobilis]MCG5535751.1 efflux RND transporter periplasmic adaptor subunit [Ectothiorhodospira mobilis]
MKRLQPVRRLLPLILLGLGVLGFTLLVITRPEQPPRSVAERTWRVTAQEIQPRSLAPRLTLYGHVQSPRSAQLQAAVTADVLRVPAREGRIVDAGADLVILDDRELQLIQGQRDAEVKDLEAQLRALEQAHERDQAALERERTLLQLAQRDLQRARDLQGRDLGSRSAVDDAQRAVEQQALAVANRQLAVNDYPARADQLRARLDRARALAEQARLDLERTHIRAPFRGRIAAVPVAPGERVRSGDPLVTLYDLDALEVRAPIPAAYLPRVRAALEAGLEPGATGRVDGLEIPLVLEDLAGESTGGSAGVEGILRVEGPTDDLPLGRFITVELALPEQPDVVPLPFEALYGMDRVYRIEDGRMRRISVQRVGEWTDASGEPRILVTGPGLEAGDRIVTTRLPNAMDGLRVTEAGE